MVRLSLALFAFAGLATASASIAGAGSSLNARGAAHNKMIKVRSPPAGSAPDPSSAPISSPEVSNSALNNSTELPKVLVKDGKDWKRDVQRFTYYETGEGACGGTNTDSDYIVALNSAQFGNGENCWKMINVWYNGKQTQAQIVDECPGCPEGGLDFSPGLFQFFSELSTGVLYGTWWFA